MNGNNLANQLFVRQRGSCNSDYILGKKNRKMYLTLSLKLNHFKRWSRVNDFTEARRRSDKVIVTQELIMLRQVSGGVCYATRHILQGKRSKVKVTRACNLLKLFTIKALQGGKRWLCRFVSVYGYCSTYFRNVLKIWRKYCSCHRAGPLDE